MPGNTSLTRIGHAFATRVVAWQRAHGRRDLPWQDTRDAYRIWLSEIMLQQTQVATVLPYFTRFVAVLPTVHALAAAPLARVLELWSGLGYYRRAHHLHVAARRVVESIDRYRRSLKRKNFAAHTVKAYMNVLAQFTRWLAVPLEHVTRNEIGAYVDHLFHKRLSPKTVTCHLQTIRLFYEYLISEEGMVLVNPVKKISIRLPKPLPRHLKDDQVANLFSVITKARDRAMFMLMLRSGLRVEEVAHLTVDAVEYGRRELFVACGKGAKDRMVYLSDDAASALAAYL